jgi:FAD synthase
MVPVFSEEKKSVDSNAIRQIQTAAGHQARRRLGREEAVESVVISARASA